MTDLPIAGMVPWSGGESAPADWDGGPVLLRMHGLTSGKPGDFRSWIWSEEGPGTIIAYTPLPIPTSGEGLLPWRCYHCDEVFTDDRCARLHFGRDEDCETACRIKGGAEHGLLGALREAEYAAADAQQAVANECTDAAKAYYAQMTRHNQALRNAEELGYERGIADARAEVTPPPEPQAAGEGLRELIAQVENGQFDELDAVADKWAASVGVQRMMNAIASVFEKHGSQDIMDRFREKLGSLMHLAFVEGAAQGLLQHRAALSEPSASEGEGAAFGASDAACYLYPGSAEMRAAFCAGAAYCADGSLPAQPATGTGEGLRVAGEDMLAAFSEGVVWNDEQRVAYQRLHAALSADVTHPGWMEDRIAAARPGIAAMIANIERWRATGNSTGPEESKALYDGLVASLAVLDGEGA